jgi:hypothetical protein
MAQASSSATATTGLNLTGGGIVENAPNYVAWIVGGIVVLTGLGLLMRLLKRRR